MQYFLKVTKILLLIFSLQLASLPIALASDCTRQAAVMKDGHLVFDQTQVKNRSMLINHVLSVISGVMSGIKMVGINCGPPMTPSYYGYNGANIIDGVFNLMHLTKGKKKASEQLLEAFTGTGADYDGQIKGFEEAYKQTMDAYNQTKSRAKMFKITGVARKLAVAAAGVEAIILMTPPPKVFTVPKAGVVPYFTCVPDLAAAATASGATAAAEAQAPQVPEPIGGFSLDAAPAATTVGGTGEIAEGFKINNLGDDSGWAQKASNNALVNNGALGLGRNWTGGLLAIVGTYILSNQVGEVTPMNRLIFYGAMEVMAMVTGGATGDAAECIKQRADEYKNMANELRRKQGLPEFSSSAAMASADPFESMPCLATTNGSVVADPNCACQQTNSCFQMNGLSSDPNMPAGVNQALGVSQELFNAVASGNSERARIAANVLESKAGQVSSALLAAQNALNAERAKKGLAPINFQQKSQELYDKMYAAVDKALQEANINSIDEFNEAINNGSINLKLKATVSSNTDASGNQNADEPTVINFDVAAEEETVNYVPNPEDPEQIPSPVAESDDNIFKIVTFRMTKIFEDELQDAQGDP